MPDYRITERTARGKIVRKIYRAESAESDVLAEAGEMIPRRGRRIVVERWVHHADVDRAGFEALDLPRG